MVNSLKRFEILKNKNQFNSIFEKGTRIHGKYLLLLFLSGPERLAGFTVTKACRTAVKRNYCKRLLRELYRKHRHHFDKCLFILHLKSLNNLNYNDLNNDFMEIIKKYKLLDPKVNNSCD